MATLRHSQQRNIPKHRAGVGKLQYIVNEYPEIV